MSVSEDRQPSDDERARIVERLTEHVGTGHLTLGEFDERVQRVHAATSGAELDLVIRDLPARAAPLPSRPLARRWLISVFGGSTITGRWRLGKRLRCIALFGGDDIDFRNAELDESESLISVIAVFGGHEVYLPAGVDVRMSTFALFGGNDVHGTPQPVAPGGPVLHVQVFSLFGGSDIWLAPPDAGGLSLREVRRRIKRHGLH